MDPVASPAVAPLAPRLVDWTILVGVVAALATGLVSLVAATPGDWWIFAVHGAVGVVVLVPLYWKLRRVRRRVFGGGWSPAVAVSVALTVLTLAAIGSGVAWVFGANVDLLYWNLMNLHVLLGLLVVPLLLGHLYSRFRRPRASDFEGRRTALTYAGLAVAGAGAYGLQRAANRVLDTAGADRRFTGSRERGSFAGNAFPVTAWVADDPDPVDPEEWTLSVTGAVDEDLALEYDAVAGFEDRETATLDCTSGWYTRQDWGGLRVGRLLDRAGPVEGATHVTVHSVTGYRWTLPIDEARETLLATRVGDERLDNGHGFPLRLVAPGRRGFQWVKWVESVEVRTDPDPGSWAAIFTSWL